jgi:CopG family nickel-responsive transcriptional regulator
MDNVTRIGVSLEPELLKSFDVLVAQKGFATRSEAIRDLIRNALVQESLTHDESHAGHHHLGLTIGMVSEGEHDGGAASSSPGHLLLIHVHLDEEKCLEVLVVHGTVGIHDLVKALTNVRA